MTVEARVGFFFAPPEPEQMGELVSALHLVRRELQDCFIGKLVAEDQVLAEAAKERHRIFATVMVIGAGFDLLAKCYAGSDKPGEVGERFTRFLKAFVFQGSPDADDFAEAVYFGVRNPIVHSFSLNSKTRNVTLMSRFDDRGDCAVSRVHNTPDTFIVGVEGLVAAFLKSVRAYELLVRSDEAVADRFSRMLEVYGTVPLGVTCVWSKP